MTTAGKWLFGVGVIVVVGAVAFTAIRLRTVTPLPLVVYPRVAMYSHLRAMVRPIANGYEIDTATVKNQARWDVVIIDPPAPGSTAKHWAAAAPVPALLKQYNPRITLLAYIPGALFVCGNGWYGGALVPGCDTTTFAWHQYCALRATGGILWSKVHPGQLYLGGGQIDFARHDSTGYVTANALADTILAAVQRAGSFDGIFLDGPCSSVLWTQGADSLDFQRSGYPSLEAWDAGYRAGVVQLFARLRAGWPAGRLVGNCGPSGPRELANGWMRENFPYQDGGTWMSNMVETPWADPGYLADDSLYCAPRLCWLTSMRSGSDSTSAWNQQRARFGLASATLAGGVHAVVGSSFDPLRGYLPWWLDEFAVTSKGASTADPQFKGWLGAPLGAATTDSTGIWWRSFKGGVVIVNPTDQPQQLAIGNGYRRIRGVLCINVNNGMRADSLLAIPAHDGLFLQRLVALP